MDRITGCLLVFLFLLFAGFTSHAQVQGPVITLERLTDLRSQDKEDSRLMVTLKISGGDVSRSLEYGSVQIKEPEVLNAKISGADPDGFAPLKRGGFGDNLNEAFLSFELPSPPRAQSVLTALSGTLKLKTYRQQLVPIEQVLTKLNQTITDPLFKVHGIDVRVVDPRQAFPGVTEEEELKKLRAGVVALEISGNTRKVREFVLETPEGQRLKTRAGSFGAGRTLILSQRSEDPLPESVIAKVVIPVAPEEVAVTFRLEKVELP